MYLEEGAVASLLKEASGAGRTTTSYLPCCRSLTLGCSIDSGHVANMLAWAAVTWHESAI